MNRFKNILKVFLGVPLTLIAFLFIGKTLIDSWPRIQEHIVNANFTLIVIGVFFMLVFFLVRSFAWIKILNLFGELEKTNSESIYHYSLAETKRYIPGNIFSFISRVQKFNTKDFSKKSILHSLLLESFIMVISSILISVSAILNLVERYNYSAFVLPILGLIILVVFLTLKFFKNKVRALFPQSNFFSYIDVVFISSIAWGAFGIGNYFFASAIFPSDPNNILIFSSIFVLSWLVGYLSFVTPMGLGVREAVTVFLLSPFLPVFFAAAISIFTRIMFIFSEVIFLFLAWFANFLHTTKKFSFVFRPIHLVAFFSFLYVAYFSHFTIIRHLNFFTGKFDLGNMEQTVWNTLNGRFFTLSNPDGITEISRLGVHADFILVLLSPFYFFFQSAITLLIIQTVIIGIGGYFVYLLAKKIIGSEKIAVVLSLGFYLNYFVQEQNIFDFHAVSLATTFLLGAFYFLNQKRMKLFSLLLILAVLTKENVYLVSSLVGAYIFLKGRKIFGLVLFTVSIAAFLFLMTVAIPSARSNDHFALSYLSYLGDSPLQIILSPLLRPAAFFGRLFSPEAFEYLYLTFLPVGFLSFFSPLYAIFALPDFLINVMSDNPNLRSIQYHYGALIIPFVYISTIYGIRKFLSLRKNRELFKNIIFYYLLGFVIFSTYKYSPLPGMKNADSQPFYTVHEQKEIFELLATIPPDAVLSATNNIAAHLSQREKIYVAPYGLDFVEYAVFYKDSMDIAYELLMEGEFIDAASTKDFLILKRINLRDTTDRP